MSKLSPAGIRLWAQLYQAEMAALRPSNDTDRKRAATNTDQVFATLVAKCDPDVQVFQSGR